MTTSQAFPVLPTPKAAARVPTDGEVRRFLPLVKQAALQFRRRLPGNVLLDELVAAGMCGLLDALRRCDPEAGPSFEWYARVRIRGAIVDDLRTHDWLSRRQRRAVQRESQAPASGCTGVVSLDDLSSTARSASLVDDSLTPLEAALAHGDRKLLDRAVQKLPEREQRIVAEHYLRDVPFKDIAADLGVSVPRVSQLHTRAMTSLRALLQQECDEAA
jgi:RNA polymerase sigma factor for flagellar operon FliA